jgi:hypothetical protein
MMYEMFPYWMPALAGCALVTACAGLIQVCCCAVYGYLYGYLCLFMLLHLCGLAVGKVISLAILSF